MLSRCAFLSSRYARPAARRWASTRLPPPTRHERPKIEPRFTPEQAQEKYAMRMRVLDAQKEKDRLKAQQEGDLRAQTKVYSDYAAAKQEAQETLAKDLRIAHGEIPSDVGKKDDRRQRKKGTVRSPYSFRTILSALVGLILLEVTVEVLAPERYKPRNWYNTFTTHNINKFQNFEIIERETISSTSSLLTLRPMKSTRFWEACKEAQQKGVWNVQFKQPQIQVVRAYTPLPNLVSDHQNLTFLIRHETGGEVSTWLRRLPIGSQVELRGPFLEFEVPKETDRVVFLAGGTGIAPALQAAEALLNPPTSSDEGVDQIISNKKIDILWACRWREDCMGGLNSSSSAGTETALDNSLSSEAKAWYDLSAWWKTSSNPPQVSAKPSRPSTTPPNEMVSRLTTLQSRFPGRVSVTYFVDEEGTHITADAIRNALSVRADTIPTKTPATSPAITQPSQTASQISPIRSTSSPSTASTSSAPFLPSAPTATAARAATPKTQILVSGPDGFIAALAGPKQWTKQGEVQGRVGGIVGQVLAERQQQRVDEGGELRGQGVVSVWKI